MPTLRTRAAKASALTHNELDANFKRTVTQKTTTYQVLISDNRSIIECDGSGTAFTVTLPTVAAAGAAETGDFEVTITNIDAAIVTVDGSGAETIDGFSSINLAQWETVTCQLNAGQTAWKLINNYRTQTTIDRNARWGLLGSMDTDTVHDVNFTAGACWDSTGVIQLNLASEITKQLDAAFDAGNDAGGLFTGTIAADTWYHCFIIRKDSDGTIDVGFDTDEDCANIPSGYTYYQYLGVSVLTDATPEIIPWYQFSDRVMWATPTSDYNSGTPLTETLVTLTVPTFSGRQIWAEISATLDRGGSGATNTKIYPTALPEPAPAGTLTTLAIPDVNAKNSSTFMIPVDASAQIAHVSSDASQNLRIQANGWEWRR